MATFNSRVLLVYMCWLWYLLFQLNWIYEVSEYMATHILLISLHVLFFFKCFLNSLAGVFQNILYFFYFSCFTFLQWIFTSIFHWLSSSSYISSLRSSEGLSSVCYSKSSLLIPGEWIGCKFLLFSLSAEAIFLNWFSGLYIIKFVLLLRLLLSTMKC